MPDEMKLEELQAQFERAAPGPEKVALGFAFSDRLTGQGLYQRAGEVLAAMESPELAPEARTGLLRRRSEILFRRSDYPAAAELLELAIAGLGRRSDSLERFYCYCQQAHIRFRQGYLDEARASVEFANQVLGFSAGQTGEDIDVARAARLHIMGLIEGASGYHDSAARSYQEEIALLDRWDRATLLGRAYNNLAGVYKADGLLMQALEYQERALAIARRTDDPLSQAICCNNLGELCLQIGDPEQALAYYQQYLEINGRIGNRLGDAFGHAGIGRIHASQGDFKLAEGELNLALGIAREIHSRGKEAGILADLADLYCLWGRIGEAGRCLDQAVQISLEIQLFNSQRHQLLGALILLARADEGGPQRAVLLDKAQRELEDLLNRPIVLENEEAVSATDVEIEAHHLLAQACQGLNQRDQAEREFKRASSLISSYASQFDPASREKYLSKRQVREILIGRHNLG